MNGVILASGLSLTDTIIVLVKLFMTTTLDDHSGETVA